MTEEQKARLARDLTNAVHEALHEADAQIQVVYRDAGHLASLAKRSVHESSPGITFCPDDLDEVALVICNLALLLRGGYS